MATSPIETVSLDTVPISYIFDEAHRIEGYREQAPGAETHVL